MKNFAWCCVVLVAAALPGRAEAAGSCLPPGAGSAQAHVTACTYAYTPSPAGNANYFASIAISYVTNSATSGVRFRCTFANTPAGTRYVVWTQPSSAGVPSQAKLSLVAPSASGTPLTCDIDPRGVFR